MKIKKLNLILFFTLLIPINFATYAFEKTEIPCTEIEELLQRMDVQKSKADLAPPVFNDDAYQQRLEDVSSEIELTFNNHVKKAIRFYTEKERNRSAIIVGRSTMYFPIFEDVFEAMEVPDDLKYLAIVESTLRPNVRSKAGAYGLWQFMPTTGEQFKLEQNYFVDERADIYQSTVAAARYLKSMNKRFDNWLLTIAAYNCGPNRVKRAMKEAGSNDFWDVYEYLPKETRGYVPSFIAVAYTLNYYDLHKIYPKYPRYSSRRLTSKLIHEQMDLRDVAAMANLPLEKLMVFNASLKRNIIPATEKGYRLVLPKINMDYFLGKKSIPMPVVAPEVVHQVPTSSPILASASGVNDETIVLYEFKKGDNLWEIARQYEGVSVKDILDLNNIGDYRKLRPGVRILIKTKA